jgi:hypothetical protein
MASNILGLDPSPSLQAGPFKGADKTHNSVPSSVRNIDKYFGNGILNVPRMLKIVPEKKRLRKEPVDDVQSDLWRSATALNDIADNKDRMFEVEFLQATVRSSEPELRRAIEQRLYRRDRQNTLKRVIELGFHEVELSTALRRRLEEIIG